MCIWTKWSIRSIFARDPPPPAAAAARERPPYTAVRLPPHHRKGVVQKFDIRGSSPKRRHRPPVEGKIPPDNPTAKSVQPTPRATVIPAYDTPSCRIISFVRKTPRDTQWWFPRCMTHILTFLTVCKECVTWCVSVWLFGKWANNN